MERCWQSGSHSIRTCVKIIQKPWNSETAKYYKNMVKSSTWFSVYKGACAHFGFETPNLRGPIRNIQSATVTHWKSYTRVPVRAGNKYVGRDNAFPLHLKLSTKCYNTQIKNLQKVSPVQGTVHFPSMGVEIPTYCWALHKVWIRVEGELQGELQRYHPWVALRWLW